MRFRIRHCLFVRLVSLATILLSFTNCSDNDCPLSNVVRCYYTFYSSETGKTTSCSDTITVCMHDSILLNKMVNGSKFDLPLSYTSTNDTVSIHFNNETDQSTCRFILSHTNIPHYESLECGASFFHKITDIALLSSSTLPPVDSIVIIHSDVNYNKNENIRIYLSRP